MIHSVGPCFVVPLDGRPTFSIYQIKWSSRTSSSSGGSDGRSSSNSIQYGNSRIA